MQKYRISIRVGPRNDPGFQVERTDILSGRVQNLASFSQRAAAIRFAVKVSEKHGWTFPTAQILTFDRRVSA